MAAEQQQQRQPSRTSASPSPPPRPPAAASAGPRASTLLKIYDDAITKLTSTCSYANFAACFPTPAEHAPDSLRGLHRDFVTKLGDICRGEFAALVEQRGVVASLNELDALLAEAKRRKARAEEEGSAEAPHPPHLLQPDALLAAHLDPFLDEQRQSLDASIAQSKKENETLAEEVARQRAEIEALVGGLEETVKDIEAGAAALRDSSELEAVRVELESRARATATATSGKAG